MSVVNCYRELHHSLDERADWLPHSRICVRGFPCLTSGVDKVGNKTSDGSSPAVDPPPPVREVRDLLVSYAEAYRGCTSRPIDHMKPTSSRAMAVQTIVAFFPRAISARYLAVRRVCAFHAISRIFGGTRSIL
jgi:hypothetical protein